MSKNLYFLNRYQAKNVKIAKNFIIISDRNTNSRFFSKFKKFKSEFRLKLFVRFWPLNQKIYFNRILGASNISNYFNNEMKIKSFETFKKSWIHKYSERIEKSSIERIFEKLKELSLHIKWFNSKSWKYE